MPREALAAPARPIAGWRVLVPRPAGRAEELAGLIVAAGAEPLVVPLIATTPLTDSAAWRRAVAALVAGEYAWVAFTSAAAVEAAQAAARAAGIALGVPEPTRVAVVGSGTAHAARRSGIRVDLMPPGPGSGAALAAAWPDEPPGTSVLLPRSDRAAADLPEALRARRSRVDEVCAYRTDLLAVPEPVARQLRRGDVEAVLLTSPSTVRALAAVELAPSTRLVAIGRPTAAAIRAAGLRVAAVAETPSAAGLVAALTATGSARGRKERHVVSR